MHLLLKLFFRTRGRIFIPEKNLDTNDMYRGRLCLISFVSLSNCAMYYLNSLLQTPRGKPLPASRPNPETGVTTLCRSTTRSRPRYRVTGSRSPVGLILNYKQTSLSSFRSNRHPTSSKGGWVLGPLLVKCFWLLSKPVSASLSIG